jgi:hypothetical protein
MYRLSVFALLFLAGCGIAAATDCTCDLKVPESMLARQCGLCREAELQPAETKIFFLKDVSPRKPNRWLALPRSHGTANHELHDMSPAERTALWTAAIAKAKSVWGNDWGLAYNGIKVRTQCHTHIHIGKLLAGIETSHFIVVSNPSEIQAPAGEGIWVHPSGSRLHVHLGEQATETVLFR